MSLPLCGESQRLGLAVARGPDEDLAMAEKRVWFPITPDFSDAAAYWALDAREENLAAGAG
jgi:hypothetical protein